jgi:hypothetical protein
MSTARQLAEAAVYEADAPLREQEAQRQREREASDRKVKQQSSQFLKRAKRKIKTVLGVDASGWEVVESHPTYAVLRDPEDESYHKLTLVVSSWESGRRLKLMFCPYAHYGKDYTNNRRGDGLDWHCGPEVTDVLSLGRAIQAHEKHEADIARSMPDHLP